MSARRVLVVAGEASADRHAARMLGELRRLVPVRAFGMGGAELERAGLELRADLRRTSAMGTTELVPRLPRIAGAFVRLAREIAVDPPALAILVDLPDFNLPLARILAARGVRVLYYLGPQVWAWRRGRLAQMARTVRRAALVLPFEPPLYERAGIAAEFVGHPLLDDAVPPRVLARRELGIDDRSTVVALLPGSRPAELRHHLPPLLGAARRLGRARHGSRFLLPVAPSISTRTVERALDGTTVEPVVRPARQVLAAADLALCATGTATLEAACAGTPSVFFHRASALTWGIGRAVVTVPHLALPNLLLGRRAVPELWQGELTAPRLAREAESILGDPAAQDAQRRAMAEVRASLGAPGAAARVAKMAAEMLP